MLKRKALKMFKMFREKTIQKLLADALDKVKLPEVKELLEEIKELSGKVDGAPKLKLKISELKKDISDLKLEKTKEVKELKLNRDIEERDLKHLIKLKEESLEVKKQQNELTVKSEYKDKEMALQKEYFWMINRLRKNLTGKTN